LHFFFYAGAAGERFIDCYEAEEYGHLEELSTDPDHLNVVEIRVDGNSIQVYVDGVEAMSFEHAMPETPTQFAMGVDSDVFGNGALHGGRVSRLIIEGEVPGNPSGRETFLVACCHGKIFSGNLTEGLTQRGGDG